MNRHLFFPIQPSPADDGGRLYGRIVKQKSPGYRAEILAEVVLPDGRADLVIVDQAVAREPYDARKEMSRKYPLAEWSRGGKPFDV